MKKYYFLIIVALILGLILTGCSLLSNISQVPATEQSEVSSLTKDDLNFDVDCPAAPAVAGLLLEAVGIDNRYGTGRDGGNFIADVAHEMGPETDLRSVDKCDIENYRIEIAKFLIEKGADVAALFEAELESVVYEGTCNTFGTNAGETMTFTFSNDVVLDPDLIPWPTPIVYFDVVSAIGTGPLLWTAEGNQVVITTTGTFNTPRPDVGDRVTGLAGIVDTIGFNVIVPAGGVEIEGIVTYDLLGDWMMDLYTSAATFVDRFVVIDTFEDGVITGFFGIGYDSTGAPTGEITGTVDGQLISMHYERTDIITDYTADFEGTIEDCDFISGTWTDGNYIDEAWEMYR